MCSSLIYFKVKITEINSSLISSNISSYEENAIILLRNQICTLVTVTNSSLNKNCHLNPILFVPFLVYGENDVIITQLPFTSDIPNF